MPSAPFARLVGPLVRTNYLEVSESTYERGLVQPLHAHDPAYITAVVSGGYRETTGGVTRDVAGGMFIFHPAGEEHAVDFRAPVTRVFRLLPRPAMLEAQRLTRACFARLLAGSAQARDLVLRIRSCYRNGDPLAPLLVDGLACELVVACAPTNRRAEGTGRAAARHARDLIEAHLERAPSLQELAGQAGCHAITLARAFRASYGCSVGSYARRRRAEEAARLLAGGDLPIAMVAHSCGFADQAHLTRELRRHVGCTPGALRAFKTRPNTDF